MAAAVETVKPLVIAALLLAGCATRPGSSVRLALQPPSTNNYPSYLAEWLGFYRAEGVDVAISQIAGASKVLEAVVGASADVGGGVYEQTIQMAAEDRDIVSFVSLLRSPNFALVSAGVKTVADLRHKTVGVSSVGSPSQFYLNQILISAGMKPSDVSTASVGMGATATAAVEHGQVDAAVLFGSAVTTLQARHPDTVILADARTADGLRAVFGVDDYPASCLLTRRDWLTKNPETARKIARAILRSLAWIRGHSAEEILAQVPAEFRVGDPAAELAAIRLAQPMYSVDGRISAASADAVRKVLAGSLDRVRDARIDLTKTYSYEYLPGR
jgi:NitT/TauT family transport system substrate-binding protein